jgi:hypothetical protein
MRRFVCPVLDHASQVLNDHGGRGPILFHRVLPGSEFRSKIDFVDCTVIPPGSTIGPHEHHGNEEKETLDGVVVSDYQSTSQGGVGGEDADAYGFAEQLAILAGGPVIRAVVLVGQSPCLAGFRIVASYPRLVIQMGAPAVLAYSAPASWDRFLVLASDSCNPFALFSRTGTELRGEMLNVEQSADLAILIRVLNIDRCLTTEDLAVTDDGLWEIVAVDRKLRNGAISRFDNELLGREGVPHRADRSTMAVLRSVNYSAIRPQLAVLDPRESSLSDAVESRPVLIVSETNMANIYSDAWRNYARQSLSFAGEVIPRSD